MSGPEAGAPPLPDPTPAHSRRPILCCDELSCTRRRPLGLYLTDLAEPYRVYVVTRWHERRGKPGHFVADERHEVTTQMREFIRRNPEWVSAVLRSRTLQI